MKRILPLLLLCLFLWGCGPVTGTQETIRAAQATASTQPEKVVIGPQVCFDGALLVYSPGVSDATGLYPMGRDLLVLSGTEQTTLTILQGEELAQAASITLSFLLTPQDPSLRVGDGYLSFFDPLERETLVLDSSLRTVSHIPAPEDLEGVPILSGDRNSLYYCAKDGIRVWDLEAGLRRRIKEMAFPGQSLAGLALQDTVLLCAIPQEGQSRTTLVSAQTGSLIYEATGDITLSGQNGWYSASLPRGLDQVLLCGEDPENPQLFLPEEGTSQCFYLTNHPGAVTYGNQGVCRLDYYNLLSGRRISSLTLDAGFTPIAEADTPEGALYILARMNTTWVIFRWEVTPDNALAVQETNSYLSPYKDDPEAANQCGAYAARLSEKFGISIRIGQEAARVPSPDFRLEPETQPGILLRELQKLEQSLSVFPDSLLPDTASHFSSLNLCLVQSITDTSQTGSREFATGAQFLDGTDAYVVITAGKDSGQALYRELFHIMETHILTESSALDQWNKLNPQTFAYTYGISAPEASSEEWLAGENQAFLDVESMTFPKEDRSRIFQAAMLPGNKDTFRPWILQRKLTAICKGIREAYGLTESPESYPWEQYLDASLAYKG